jgi:hypothetical protein
VCSLLRRAPEVPVEPVARGACRLSEQQIPVLIQSDAAGRVELPTASRRIISYLLSPLMHYNQEILRER